LGVLEHLTKPSLSTGRRTVLRITSPAVGIEDEAGLGSVAVDPFSTKACNTFSAQVPARFRFQHEHRAEGKIATLGSAALVRRAVEIPGGIEDQTGEGTELSWEIPPYRNL
jgi:hypothetical protein